MQGIFTKTYGKKKKKRSNNLELRNHITRKISKRKSAKRDNRKVNTGQMLEEAEGYRGDFI